jgi:hypothetical protein
MKFRQSRRTWVVGLFFSGFALLLVSCDGGITGGPGGPECAGIETVTSCVTVRSVQPVDGATDVETSDVDAVQVICSDGSDEPFAAHRVDVTFNNTTFPEFVNLIDEDEGGTLPVTILGFEVTYRLDFCPPNTICPPLTGFSRALTLEVPAQGEATQTVDFVPLNVKDEFVSQGGGDVGAFPLYAAEYTFVGKTNFFEDSFEVTASVPFVIGNFDNCEDTQ